MHNKISTVVFPVAGFGTRCLPATKSIPKELLTVVDKPLIQYAVEEARAGGIEDFVFVTSPDKGAIQDHFDVSPALEDFLKSKGKSHLVDLLEAVRIAPGHASYVFQTIPKGLGHAISCAKSCLSVGKPFAVILPDDLVLSDRSCLAQMVDAYASGVMVAVEDVAADATQSYGILDIQEDLGRVVTAKGVVEKPRPEEAPSNTAIIGRYILPYEIFDVLEHQAPGAGGEIQLTDAFNPLMKTLPFQGYRFDGRRFDCGTKYGLLEANIAYACVDPDHARRLAKFLQNSGLGEILLRL